LYSNLVALHNGLNAINSCNIPNGLIYAQELLKLASLNDDDVDSWIQFNFQSYPFKLLHDIILQIMNSETTKKKRFKEILLSLDSLYGVPPDESRLAGIESMMRVDATGKLSSMTSMMVRGFTSSTTTTSTTAAASGSGKTNSSLEN
jgi:hypothetical protein